MAHGKQEEHGMYVPQEQLSRTEIEEGERAARRREDPGRIQFFLTLNLGLFLTAIGIEVFKAPNHFALGGTSGLSIILSTLFPKFPVSAFMWLINLALVLLGLAFLDRRTMGWTVFSSFALSFYVSILERLIPLSAPLTNDTLLELIFAVGLPAVGSAIVFNIGASTGGTDILAMVLKKYSSLQIGKALLLVDAAIVATAAALYGPRTGLYCILGLISKSFVVDSFIENVNTQKVCTVICSRPNDVVGFLVSELHRTATVREERGAFTGRPETVLVTVLSRREATRLRIYLRETDPHAFMTMVNSSEIVGRGFRGV
jgi:uncharacterized membrane-anchored protein YitT (DUF2179 family)